MAEDDVEVRHLPGLRADVGEGRPPRLAGYAIRTNSLSEPLAGGLFRETITPAAVRAALAASPDLVALVNHDHGRVLGRVSAKTLRVEQDERGLKFEVDLPAHEAGLAESVARGDLPYASFEFHRAKDELDRTTTADVVKRLEDRGLVERRANPSDKRTRHVRLTAEGQTVVDSLRGDMARAQERLLAPLRPAERTMLMDLMKILVEANNQYSRTVLRAI